MHTVSTTLSLFSTCDINKPSVKHVSRGKKIHPIISENNMLGFHKQEIHYL